MTQDTLTLMMASETSLGFDPKAVSACLQSHGRILTPSVDHWRDIIFVTNIEHNSTSDHLRVVLEGPGEYTLDVLITKEKVAITGTISNCFVAITPDVEIFGDTKYICHSRVFLCCFFMRVILSLLLIKNGKQAMTAEVSAGQDTRLIKNAEAPSPEEVADSPLLWPGSTSIICQVSSDPERDIRLLLDEVSLKLFGQSLQVDCLINNFIFSLWIESIREGLWDAMGLDSQDWQARLVSYQETIRLRREKLMKDYADYVRKRSQFYQSPDVEKKD